MALSLTKNFSGVIVNQNVTPAAGNSLTVSDDLWRYQTFTLPNDYPRGNGDQRTYPELSGFQINAKVLNAETAKLTYTFDVFRFGVGWITLASGVAIGAPHVGERVWVDVYFDEPIEIAAEQATDIFRIGLKSPIAGSLQKIWFSTPNPLTNSSSRLYASDGTSAVVANGSNDLSILFRVLALTADEGEDVLGNKYRSVLTSLPAGGVDPATSNSYWLSQPNPSRFAVEAMYFDMRDNIDGEVAVDGMLIDPVTPGMWANVYYTSEGNPGVDEADWDNKLWTRVKQSWKIDKRENIVFPEPVVAKYIKVEFSHLQARHYSPGRFARPVKYKKHPKWVLDYFLIRLADANAQANKTTSNRVRVVYDALDLAYNYYLDDLSQLPDQPVEADPTFQSVINTYLGDRSDTSDKIDASMIDQINYATRPYKSGVLVNSSDSLLATVLRVNTDGRDEPTESDRVGSLANVSPALESLAGQAVAFENDYPVMFFYLQCRHGYREVMANFQYDKAYFAGVREIAFLRNSYTSAADSQSYVEVGGDLVNTTRNDFSTGSFAKSGRSVGDLGAEYFRDPSTGDLTPAEY